MKKLALIFILLSSPAFAFESESDHANSKVAFTMVLSDGRRMKLGSRPPRCADRCYNCRPCIAALVVSPNTYETSIEGEETYHLLSWKCHCGSKYYQP